MHDEQSDEIVEANLWDFLALFSNTLADMFVVIASFFETGKDMLLNKASHVEDDKNFHEYVARTIETLNEGD